LIKNLYLHKGYIGQQLLEKHCQATEGKSKVFKRLLKTSSCDRHPRSGRRWIACTVEYVILLVTLCSVRKVHHRHVNQYFKY